MKVLIYISILISFSFSGVIVKPNDALSLHFKGATITKEIILLSKDKHQKAQQLAKQKIKSKMATFYLAKKGDEVLGYGGILTQRVRTKNATAMVIIDKVGNIKAIEMIAFYEPREYLPSKRWLEIFDGKNIDNSLKLKEDIPVVSGATLSAKSINDAARVMLAIWNVSFRN